MSHAKQEVAEVVSTCDRFDRAFDVLLSDPLPQNEPERREEVSRRAAEATRILAAEERY